MASGPGELDQQVSKAKPKSTVYTLSEPGVLTQVKDRRFESGEWPIRFEVPREQANTWLKYLHADLQARGWNSSGLTQMEPRENSGSFNVNAGAPDKPQFAVVWEWELGRSMKVRSRSTGVPALPIADALTLFAQVNEKCRLGIKEPFYRRWQLEYHGLPWRGEFWLGNTLRLGPPSRQYETALLGPRIIIVDAVVEAISPADASSVFGAVLCELSAFLSVVLGTAVQLPEQGQAWISTFSNGGDVESSVQHLGYIERENPTGVPVQGVCRPVPLDQVNRPDFSLRGIDGSVVDTAGSRCSHRRSVRGVFSSQ